MNRGRYLDFKTIKKHARELRKSSTASEKLLWEQLRNRRLSGYKFLRQHPIVYKADYKGLNYFFADFYCHEKQAVIELDGLVHNETEEYDQFRDEEMRHKGINVMRLKNAELGNMENTLDKIKFFLYSIP
jgi:very-short-patch-repair endonuclease